MDSNLDYFNQIQTENNLINEQKTKAYQKKELSLQHLQEIAEPLNLVGSEMLMNGVRGLGGKVLNALGETTGSKTLKGLADGVRTGKISDIKGVAKNLREQAENTLKEKIGDLQQSANEFQSQASESLKGSKPTLESIQETIRQKGIKARGDLAKAQRKAQRKAEKAKRKAQKEQEAQQTEQEAPKEEQSRLDPEGSSSDPMASSKIEIVDPFSDKPTAPKPEEPQPKAEEPVLDDEGNPIKDSEEELREKQAEQERAGILDRENPLDRQILERVEQSQREASTSAEQPKTLSQVIEDLQQKIAPPPPKAPPTELTAPPKAPTEQAEQVEQEPVPRVNPADLTGGLDPSQLPQGAGARGAGGQIIPAQRPASPTQQPKADVSEDEHLDNVESLNNTQYEEYKEKAKNLSPTDYNSRTDIINDIKNRDQKPVNIKNPFEEETEGSKKILPQELLTGAESAEGSIEKPLSRVVQNPLFDINQELPPPPAPAPQAPAPAPPAPAPAEQTQPKPPAPAEQTKPTAQAEPKAPSEVEDVGAEAGEEAGLGELGDLVNPVLGLGLMLLPQLLGSGHDNENEAEAPPVNSSEQMGTN